jgi:hypothetical protein
MATDSAGNKGTASFKVNITRTYKYTGFFSPVSMGTVDAYGLNLVVNSVNGGRNVPFKWDIHDKITNVEVTDPNGVEFHYDNYATFLAQFPQLPGKTALPNRNVCADSTRKVTPLSSGSTAKTGPIGFSSSLFNVGYQVPAIPASPAWNCFVVWTKVKTDASPGIVALFMSK